MKNNKKISYLKERIEELTRQNTDFKSQNKMLLQVIEVLRQNDTLNHQNINQLELRIKAMQDNYQDCLKALKGIAKDYSNSLRTLSIVREKYSRLEKRLKLR